MILVAILFLHLFPALPGGGHELSCISSGLVRMDVGYFAQIVIGTAIAAFGIWIGDWGYCKSWRNDDVRIGTLPFIGSGIATVGLILIGRAAYALWNPDHIGFY